MTQIDLPDGDMLILHGLNAPEAERGGIARLDAAGRRLWIARLPESGAQNAFIAMRIEDGAVIADSFQGFSVRLDLSTGAVLAQSFVK